MADRIRFVLNDTRWSSTPFAMTTLLDWLRDHRGLKGTKELCEGDCGASHGVLEGGRPRASTRSPAAIDGQRLDELPADVRRCKTAKWPTPMRIGICTASVRVSSLAAAVKGRSRNDPPHALASQSHAAAP